jgi:hypothetical protein
MLPPWAQIVFVGYMSRDQIHQVIAREREMLAAIEKSRPQLQLSNSRFAEQRNEIIKELEAESTGTRTALTSQRRFPPPAYPHSLGAALAQSRTIAQELKQQPKAHDKPE